MSRVQRLLTSIGKRISRQGDMHIRVSPRTLGILLREVGVKREFDRSEFREIDAVVLDSLLQLAWARQPKSAAKYLHRFNPHKKYPWYCAECGYGPGEPLKHIQPTPLHRENLLAAQEGRI